MSFDRDYWLSGTPDIPDPVEEILLQSLSPDEIHEEALDVPRVPIEVRVGDLVLRDPNDPRKGFKLSPQ